MRSWGVISHGFAVLFILLAGATAARVGAGDQGPAQCAPAVRATDTRAEGLRLGCHAAGFELIRGLDRRRRINRDEGIRIGIAVWYPAKPPANDATALAGMDYRLLERSTPPTEKERQTLEAEEVDTLVGWRHAGIVALTPAQAKASIETRGIAVPGAIAEQGRFPVAVVLGGPYYLSTTAEVLASHGVLVIAPFRFDDQSNELEGGDFRQYVANSLGDAEWALEELSKDPRADLRAVTALGHGGGGMQAMLLAMRNRSVTAVVNIDAGNFSKRSEPERNAFYGPRLMRVPYLYIATAATRKDQDRFDDFVAMQFSERTEVVFGANDIRHHDLSDIGRAVTMPMRLRGEAQMTVEKAYAGVHEMLVRFIGEHSSRTRSTPSPLVAWLESHKATDNLTVTLRPAIEPAPTTRAAIESLSDSTLANLKDARQRDPEAPLFEEYNLRELVAAASVRRASMAAPLAEFAVGLHPASAVLLAQASEIVLAAGDRSKAIETARACAALKPEADWQASIAVGKCTALLQRLPPGSPQP
jgi:hypothetical protein